MLATATRLRIGDSASDVVARLGQPYAVAEIYGGSGYLYHAGGNILRYDLDKSNKRERHRADPGSRIEARW